MEIRSTSQWIQWVIMILVTVFMGISGYNVYQISEVSKLNETRVKDVLCRVDAVAKDLVEARSAMTTELSRTKETVSKEYVTARELSPLTSRLDRMDVRFDKMEGKIDILLVRTK